jgi:hypothetical protein
MELKNSAIDAGGKAEIIRIDDEPLHSVECINSGAAKKLRKSKAPVQVEPISLSSLSEHDEGSFAWVRVP